jgi:signal transduction histidine kinase
MIGTIESAGETRFSLPYNRHAAVRPLVLVVEDDEDMNDLLCRVLERAGYATNPAFNGEEGLAKALVLRPDLILSDMVMPLKTGEELVEAVRDQRELHSTPIVLLTANTDGVLRARMLRAGAQDYVSKPFVVEELVARIANLVSAKRARDVLQQELDSQTPNLELLARELGSQKRELAAALDAARVARDMAERASQLKSAFLSLVSHELQTPIASLALQVQALLRFRDLPVERERQCLKSIGIANKRLAELVEGLLENARIASAGPGVSLEWLDLVALTAAVVEELQPQARDKGLELHFASPQAQLFLRSDARLLRLIVTHLAANAIKFTEHGSVAISVSAAEECRYLKVTDTGPGISLQDRERIFEPFEHLEDIRHKHLPGVGLGLSLVRELAIALGGEVSVESEPGGGSTFAVRLPSRADA